MTFDCAAQKWGELEKPGGEMGAAFHSARERRAFAQTTRAKGVTE
jgi:hypothetical protein